MNQSILRQFEVLETNKADILQFLREQSEDDLTKKLPEKWTMIQAMRHVQMSESGSLQYMKKKIQAGEDLPTRGLIPRLYLGYGICISSKKMSDILWSKCCPV